VFDHVAIHASDRPASERFYRTVLDALGIEPSSADAGTIEWDDFRLLAADRDHPHTRHLHVGFIAPSREHVDAFWQAAVDAGYHDDGPPGERPQYRRDYYGAFVLDPDGNSAEAVHHGDTRPGGHIDHLWIRVRDVPTAEAFYTAIARHTGLREGRRWDAGVQFRGAWATFSLVNDGRPLTENVHMAFPAPDRKTVDSFHRIATGDGHRSIFPPTELQHLGEVNYTTCIVDPDGNTVESVFHETR
jgi:catechol 2,3-dioxygenase-like lactoylglutathione lyase family enzyme